MFEPGRIDGSKGQNPQLSEPTPKLSGADFVTAPPETNPNLASVRASWRHSPAAAQFKELYRAHSNQVAQLFAETSHGSDLSIELVQGLLAGFTSVPQLAAEITETTLRLGQFAALTRQPHLAVESSAVLNELPSDSRDEWAPGFRGALRMAFELTELSHEYGQPYGYHQRALSAVSEALRGRPGFGDALTDGDIFRLELALTRYLEEPLADESRKIDRFRWVATIGSRLFAETRVREHPFDLTPLTMALEESIEDDLAWEYDHDLALPLRDKEDDVDSELVNRVRERFEKQSLLIDLLLDVDAISTSPFFPELLQHQLEAYKELCLPQVVDEQASLATFWGVTFDYGNLSIDGLVKDLDGHGLFIRSTVVLFGQLSELERRGALDPLETADRIMAGLLNTSPPGEHERLESILTLERDAPSGRSLLASVGSAAHGNELHIRDVFEGLTSESFAQVEDWVSLLGDPQPGHRDGGPTYLEAVHVSALGRLANKVATYMLDREERQELLTKAINDELLETSRALRERMTEELRNALRDSSGTA